MKILVTGGAGFIGSHFIRHMLLSYPEHTIINLDKLTYAGNLENLKDVEHFQNYSFIKGDICDNRLLDALSFDAIVNFAAESHVDRSILDVYPFLATNVIGTQNLLDAARTRRCRMLHISTDEVYGSLNKGKFTETSPLQPNSPYAASKASSDLLARTYHRTYGVEVVITRCSNNYGPFQFPEKLIPLVIFHALEGKPIPVYGNGQNIRDWIHVQDHCRAVDMVFHHGQPGEIYNIGADNELCNLDIIKKLLVQIAAITGRAETDLLNLINFVPDRPGHDKRYALDAGKIERELGWKPRTDFSRGLSSTIEWYISNSTWWKRIVSGEYVDYYKTQYGERSGQ